ncbi:MAG: hypothetical protein JSR72_03535 [Proteobacteria bacterium]|nr:hypothetical protein [Pseudomonadota bacterium]
MKDKRDGSQKWAFSIKPDATDLLKIEEKIAVFEKELKEVEDSTSLIPFQKKSRIRDLKGKIADLEWRRVEAREHVQASLYQTQVYEATVERLRLDNDTKKSVTDPLAAKRRLEMESKKEAESRALEAKAIVERGPPETLGSAPEPTPEQRRTAFEAFVRKRKLTEVERQVAQAKLLEQENETEP